jgi:hypothetical protein
MILSRKRTIDINTDVNNKVSDHLSMWTLLHEKTAAIEFIFLLLIIH